MKALTLRSLLLLIAVSVAAIAVAAPLPIRFDPSKMMRAAEIKRGMVGEAYTVFQGTEPTMFHVRILGVLPKGNNGKPYIIFRAIDGPLIERNAPVMGGMSGSPVFINGKLIGAIAFTYIFEKEPCGGITGIEGMVSGVAGKEVAQAFRPQPVRLGSRVFHKVAIAGESPGSVSDDTMLLYPCTPPIYFSSGSETVDRRVSQLLDIFGITAVPGAGRHESVPVDIKPGSGLGVELARGDFLAYTFGTVTWRDGDNIIGFGHPMRSGGDISLPLTTVYIHDFVANYRRTDKDGVIMDRVGSLTRDCPWAVGGVIGPKPPVVPAVFRVVDEKYDRAKTFSVQVARDRVYTSGISVSMLMRAIDALYYGSGEPGVAEVRYRIRGTKGAQLQRSDVFFFTSDPGGPASPELSDAMRLFIDNRFEPQQIADISAEVRIIPEQRVARIERVYTEEEAAVAGNKLTVHVVLKPVGKPLVEKVVTFDLPWELPKSGVQVVAAGGEAADQVRRLVGGFVPEFHSLDAVLRYLERLERNDKLLVAIGLPRQGAAVEDTPLPGFPAALTQRLALSHRSGVRQIKDYRLKVIDVPYVVQGTFAAALATVTRKGERGKPTPPKESTALGPAERQLVQPGLSKIAPVVSRVTAGTLPTIAWRDGKLVGLTLHPSASSPVAEQQQKQQQQQQKAEKQKKTSPDAGKVQAKQAEWALTSYDKLSKGQPDGLAIHANGWLVPSIKLAQVATLPDPIVWDMIVSADNTLVAAGLDATIYRVAEGKSQTWAKLPKGIFVSSLASIGDQVLCSTCPGATLFALDRSGKVRKSWSFDERYIWDILPTGKSSALVATGRPGRVYSIDLSSGKKSLVAVLPEDHVRYLAAGRTAIYAATSDRNALYRIGVGGRITQLAWFDTEPCGLGVMGGDKVLVGLNSTARVVCVHEDGRVETWAKLSGKKGFCLAVTASGAVLGAGPSATAIFVHGPNDWVLFKRQRVAAVYAAAAFGPDGRCWLASAAPAVVLAQQPKPKTLSYTSPAQDASRRAQVLAVTVGSSADLSGLTVKTRSGASPYYDSGLWSAWATAVPQGSRFIASAPPNRYCQVRVEVPQTFRGRILSLLVTYQGQNRRPSVKFSSPKPGAALKGTTELKWSAKDPDGDTLEAWLAYQAAGETKWHTFAARQTEGKFKWDTRKLKDGVYRIRVAVTDRPTRPTDALDHAAILAPVIIDNTKPVLEITSPARWEKGRIVLEVLATDATSGVQGVTWQYPGTKLWYTASPSDSFFGGPQELCSLSLPGDIKPGTKVTIRARDGAGNVADVTITVPKKPSNKQGKESKNK